MTPRFQRKTGQVALGGVLTAVSVVLLYIASISPSGRLAMTAVAGLCPVLAVLLSSRATGYLVWGATSVLGLILVPEKAIALCYFTIFGLYPVVKSNIEAISSVALRWVCKLAYGAGGIALLHLVLLKLLMEETPLWMSRYFFVMSPLGAVIFILYDIGLSRLIGLISKRLGGGRTP